MGLTGNAKQQFSSTQGHLAFAEIRDGVVLTKTGELRTILMVSSINFALKSEQEQNAIIFAYQNFLNSLSFPIQILMQSKRLDLSNYLNELKLAASNQANELLRVQTLDYIDFVQKLISIANIMDKKFYVVVPFMPPPKVSSSGKILKPEAGNVMMSLTEFEKYREELSQRVKVVQNGLGSIGMRSAELNTQQIIELLYSVYNPEEANKEKLTQYESLTGQVIESEIEKPEVKKKDE